MVTEAILLVVGLIVGGMVGVYVGTVRGRSGLRGEVGELGAALREVRGQLSGREEELASVRRALEQEKVSAAETKARLESAGEHLAEQREQFEKTRKELKEVFEGLAAAALRTNNEQFIKLADDKMKPLREQLERYEKQINELEKARAEAYGGLGKQVSTLEQRSDRLGRETGQLVAALRQSGTMGKWGEATLKRVVELTGMSEHCDFETQVSVPGEGGRQEPDLVVHMPGGRTLVVDSKVSTGAYLDADRATDEEERRRHLKRYAEGVRRTLIELGRKDYWKRFSPAPEFVVMFMPAEAFFAAAVALDHNLIVDGVERGVLPASPTTLIALLLAVRHGWQQEQVAENAAKIAAAGRELYERLCVFAGHLNEVGEGIVKAAKAYNSAVRSWESRTLPGARKLKELGAAEPGREIVEPRKADVPMRAATPPEDDPAGAGPPLH